MRSKLNGTRFEDLLRLDQSVDSSLDVVSRKKRALTHAWAVKEFYHKTDWQPEAFNFDLVTDGNWESYLNASNEGDYSMVANMARMTRNETKYLGHSAEDLIQTCRFDRKHCSYRNFTQFQHKMYGNCYTFQENHFTSRIGSQYKSMH